MNSPSPPPSLPSPTVSLAIDRVHPRTGAGPRPSVTVTLAAEEQALRVRFDAVTPSLLARHTEHQSMVCQDCCVEFFFKPAPGAGYLNIEANCIGTVLMHHHPSAERQVARPVPEAAIDALGVQTSLPRQPIEPERPGEAHWWLTMDVRYDVVATIVNQPLDRIKGKGRSLDWRANFYTCADKAARPYWVSWADVGEPLDFHKPARFAPLRFDAEGRFTAARDPDEAASGST